MRETTKKGIGLGLTYILTFTVIKDAQQMHEELLMKISKIHLPYYPQPF